MTNNYLKKQAKNLGRYLADLPVRLVFAVVAYVVRRKIDKRMERRK